SIFVNPIQFGPKEDFKKYPRPIKKDLKLCRDLGVDLVFYPKKEEMYSEDFKTYVFVENLSNVLCGKYRPGHFRGVTTVVAKLFNLVQPDIAYFGQKDAQQAIIIKKMVKDLNFPVSIKVIPTVRDTDGLALSSRNLYLNRNEREDALCLFEALNLAKELILRGEKDSYKIIKEMKKIIQKKKSAKVQYIEIVDLKELRPVRYIDKPILIALAVFIGNTRLIDNLILSPEGKELCLN
ncbi:MAG: pantoate--beta-alanine ligase, partial [Candidatus Omnitrophica bacterium]|nr:pantoate--beta-alanine ligase [Candidatus Omnitrophota bacterium]